MPRARHRVTHLRWVFLAGGLVFWCCIGAISTYAVWRLHTDAINAGFEISSMHSRSFEGFVTESLHVTELSAQALMHHSDSLASAHIESDLLSSLRDAPHLRSMSLVDESGRVGLSSNPGNVGSKVSLADFFPLAAPTSEVLRVGRPWSGRDFGAGQTITDASLANVSTASFVPLLKHVSGDGHYNTVLLALNADYFTNYFARTLNPEVGTVELLRYDGKLLVSTDTSATGDARPAAVVRAMQSADVESGILKTDAGNGNLSLTSFRASRLYPLVIVTHMSQAQALAGWRTEALALLGVVIPMLLGISLFATVYYRRLVQSAAQNAQSQNLQRLNATVFDASADAIIITDLNAEIISVNAAFTRITGYSAQEAVGQNPRIISSGQQSKGFYVRMWDDILSLGVWRGELINRRKDGSQYHALATITAFRDEEGELQHFIGVSSDISQRKLAENEIRHLAYYDQLTELPNRRFLLDSLGKALANTARHGRFGALMMIDLDDFKSLNDTLGHDVGDQLLVQAGSRLQSCVREGDMVARMGGDEFVVLLEHLDEGEMAAIQAEAVAAKVLARLCETYWLEIRAQGSVVTRRSHQCTATLGIALFQGHAVSVDELIKRADTAMYQAKAAGRNTQRFFDPQMQAVVNARAMLERDLHKAISEEQFVLHYQAQVDAQGRVRGAEALIRWQHPQRGLVYPGDFIAQAEETEQILPIGRWVMQTACHQLALWAREPGMAHLTISVNVSARQFSQPQFVSQVGEALTQSGARTDRLKLELTESLLLENVEHVIDTMTALRASGVSFSLDDFGTGYSSMSYLKRLPLDQLKIDQSFVRDVNHNHHDAAIARTIITLGQSLELTVIAEGVETQEQRDFLLSQGCENYQGHLFSRPLPAHAFEAFVKAQ
jgi:diguanylate cyclase (GGDEF)-like protein/PAS domain S-box-containing protein